jgi:hypothetical protein
VLGDVGDPQLVRRWAGEVAIDEIHRGRGVVTRAGPSMIRQALDPGAAHEQRDRAVPDDDAPAQRQLGVHPWGAVDAERRGVHLNDKVGQPDLAHRTQRRCPAAPVVVARVRDVEDPAGDVDRESFRGHHGDGLEQSET